MRKRAQPLSLYRNFGISETKKKIENKLVCTVGEFLIEGVLPNGCRM